MPEKNDDFLKKLLATFKIEAEEHIKKISSGLLELEKSPAAERGAQIIEAIFREAHSLKGAARAVNMGDIEAICQSLESVFASLKRKEKTISQELFSRLYEQADAISRLLASATAMPAGQAAGVGGQGSGVSRTPTPVPISPSPSLSDTVRISTPKLNSLLLKTEELLSAKLIAGQHASDLREITGELEKWGKGLGKENSSYVKSLETRISALASSAEHAHRMTGRMVDDLLGDMKKVLMLPCSSLLEIFPKFVRDLSSDQGKEVDLETKGEEIEIDRRILEEMKDPLLHIVRNCIDHGIEKSNVRGQKNKALRGRITIKISPRDGDKVEILISDDGVGVDIEKVRTAALKGGVISQDEAGKLSEKEAIWLIFRSGISTSPIITDISGRGLGLAIVQEKVEKLGGTISLETRPDAGTRFLITLPLTLATFRGILVRVGEQLFILPSVNIERVVRVRKEEIKTVENRETISINGEAVSTVRLKDVLGLTGKGEDVPSDKMQLVILSSASIRIAFIVDEIIGEQEVLVKGLGRHLSRVRNISGAALLGMGKVVPITNIPDLMKSAVRTAVPAMKPAAAQEKKRGKEKSVLVVEDSITARMLLKNILEAAGYGVKTAVDGVDGFAQAKSGEFDIVVSDVDMPRMNGFDLTAMIREDKKISDLPVVLVTALESCEDREHGIDAGADAYIVKSSFDQGNLLEAIRRLI